MTVSDLDKIFWLRAALGVVGGSLSELLTGCKVIVAAPQAGACVDGLKPDYTTGVLIGVLLFLGSYYALKGTIGKNFEKDQVGKIYTTGVGSYVLLFVFSWALLFTLGVTYLNL